MSIKPENKFRKGTIACILVEKDWSGFTIPEIAEKLFTDRIQSELPYTMSKGGPDTLCHTRKGKSGMLLIIQTGRRRYGECVPGEAAEAEEAAKTKTVCCG